MKTSTVTETHKFTEGDRITDIIAIDETHYLLAANKGLLKTIKDQLINHYHKGKSVRSLCHVTHSLYLVGFGWGDGLILWNEQTDQLLSQICGGSVFSIKRVITTNNYLIKTYEGVKVVTINYLMPLKFSVQHLIDAKEYWGVPTDSLQLQITNSHITIATTHNEEIDDRCKSSIKLMKVPIVSEM